MATADTLAAMLLPSQQIEFRQILRELQRALKDLSDSELMQYLTFLQQKMSEVAGGVGELLAMAFAEDVEHELDSRVHETAWDKAKRTARRTAQTAREWFKTDQGKAAVGLGAVVAGLTALFGFDVLGD